jgi:hypothetical protein
VLASTAFKADPACRSTALTFNLAGTEVDKGNWTSILELGDPTNASGLLGASSRLVPRDQSYICPTHGIAYPVPRGLHELTYCPFGGICIVVRVNGTHAQPRIAR